MVVVVAVTASTVVGLVGAVNDDGGPFCLDASVKLGVWMGEHWLLFVNKKVCWVELVP